MSLAQPLRRVCVAPRASTSRLVTATRPPNRSAWRCLHATTRRCAKRPKNIAEAEARIGRSVKAIESLRRAHAELTRGGGGREESKDAGKPRRLGEDEALARDPRYTEAELAKLREIYTEDQMKAVLAGEEAVSAADIHNQAALRSDPMRLEHMDPTGFSRLDPILDHPVRAPESNYDPHSRFKNDEELVDDLVDWIEGMPADPDRVEWLKFQDKVRLTVGKEEAERNPRSYLAAEIPKLADRNIVESAKLAAAAADGVDQQIKDLSRQIGISVREINRFRVKTLVTHRVVNQTRMGKIQSQYYLVVAGNQNGLLGIGEGKGTEVADAQKQATLNAIRNMKPVPRYERRTIYGDVKGKVGATELTLYSRGPGFGIRCADKIHEIAKCAGISDLASRVTRARNPMNTVKAAVQALMSQRIPDTVARARGRKMVDARKVYYAGNV